MDITLRVFKSNNARRNSLGKHFSFVIVDLERSKNYPANYVCILPAQISSNGKKPSTFSTIFGDKTLSLATQLLTDALQTTVDSETKSEIERRLKAIDGHSAKQIKCSACGRLFQPIRRRGFKQKLCSECTKEKTAA